MIGTIIAQILRFALLVLLQVLVIDHIDLANGWVVPYLYVLFILTLPVNTPTWAVLALGFLTGVVLDMFSSTPGMHASACTAMAYARGWMLRALAPREGYETGLKPGITDLGLPWFMTYAGVLVVTHHLVLFFVEVYRFDAFFSTFARALVSAAATLVLCLLGQLLTARSARNR